MASKIIARNRNMKRAGIPIKLLFGVIALLLFFGRPTPVSAGEYALQSSDGQINVVFDSLFGGAITKIYDSANFGSTNLIDNNQAGAMFQVAFWAGNYYSQLPPNCPESPDMHWDNPTQAGFRGNGLAGNPIGTLGVGTGTGDSKEFINYENNNKVIHLKTRFIRWNYCRLTNSTPLSERNLWDTGFYLEQWAYFHPEYPHALVLKSKISYEDTNYTNFAVTWQVPVIFAHNLTNVVYSKSGSLINTRVFSGGFDPDQEWAALIDPTKSSGIGLVMAPGITTIKDYKIGITNSGFDLGGEIETIYPGGWIDWRKLGKLTNVSFNANNNSFDFQPLGTFDWTIYYPIGKLATIQQNAASLLANWTSNPPAPYNSNIFGYVDSISCNWASGWVADRRNYANKVTVKAEISPVGEPTNVYIINSLANIVRADLPGVCPPNGACSYANVWGSFPASFTGKQLTVKAWGIATDGAANLIPNIPSSTIGPCL